MFYLFIYLIWIFFLHLLNIYIFFFIFYLLNINDLIYMIYLIFIMFFCGRLLQCYRVNKFSQLFVFLLKPSKCFKILRRCLLLRRLVAWSRSLCGFNFIWASIPTNNSSTWWARPDDVSINLQPQLLAILRPTKIWNNKNLNYLQAG